MQVAPSDRSFYWRLLATAAFVCGLYLVWRLYFLLLLLFAAILVATLLTGFAGFVARHTRLSERWALVVVTLGLAVLLAGATYLFGARLQVQFAHAMERIPGAIDAAGEWIDVSNAAEKLSQALSDSGIRYVPQAASVGYGVLSTVSAAILVVAGALYLAADPGVYRRGLSKLFPRPMRPEILRLMDTLGTTFRLWFLGQLVSMVLVGVLSAGAYWLIGLPIPFALGALAGITNFVPIAGPFLGGAPAVLFAFTQDLSAVAWTVGAIFVIQQVDGNVVSPLIQRQVIRLPPAVLLFALVAMGILFGWLGIILAAPLTVAAMVTVQKLWVREVIGDEVEVAGEDAKADGAPSSLVTRPRADSC
ncbi:AI-2E family transporter [Reyranella sp.]|uniref:AI-2E family transporter n=1 Tax=Reyranella sp. TaxID=1929291 RepID=UPI003BA93149